MKDSRYLYQIFVSILGWFHRTEMRACGLSGCGLNFGYDPSSPCSWEAVMTLLTCRPSNVRITLLMVIPSESDLFMPETNEVVNPIDMNVQSLTGGFFSCHKSVLSGKLQEAIITLQKYCQLLVISKYYFKRIVRALEEENASTNTKYKNRHPSIAMF